jgi:hypothetical protein
VTKACGATVAEYTVDFPAACQATACDTGPALRMCTIGEACPGAKTCKPIVVYRGGKPVTQGACL